MKRSTIILSILGLLLTSTLMAAAQGKSMKNANRPPGGRSLVENQHLAGTVKVRRNALTSILNPSSIVSQKEGALRSNASRPNRRTETVDNNETITVHGRSSSQRAFQGIGIGTNVRPRRNGLSGDFNGDGSVDAVDYLRSPGQRKKGQDIEVENDETHRSSRFNSTNRPRGFYVDDIIIGATPRRPRN